MSDMLPSADYDARTEVARMCCCHGHLDGLTEHEMKALGAAPCPTLQAFDFGVSLATAEVRAHVESALDRWDYPPFRTPADHGASQLDLMVRAALDEATRPLPPGVGS